MIVELKEVLIHTNKLNLTALRGDIDLKRFVPDGETPSLSLGCCLQLFVPVLNTHVGVHPSKDLY